MSHFPSENVGVKSMQIDVDGASTVSDDIVTHTKTTFNAKAIYFIDHRYFLTSSSSTSSRAYFSQMTGFSFMGGITRANAITGVNTAADSVFCGVNARDVDLVVSESSSGSAPITVETTFKSYWRIL